MAKLSFSERNGYKEVRETVQKENIDEHLRINLWNVLYLTLFDNYDPYEKNIKFFRSCWLHFFHQRIDTFSFESSKKHFKTWFLYESLWNEIYDFLEFLACVYKNEETNESINLILESNNTAYRLINGDIVEITSEQEIAEIETATKSRLEEINEHINQSLHLLSNRENPDYRNSIKESISAVECLCRKITGKDDLGKAISNLEQKGIILNTQLKEGLSHLYKYTNGENGIRHSIMDLEEEVNMEDARFMLVICSSFVNYIIEKANKIGVDFS